MAKSSGVPVLPLYAALCAAAIVSLGAPAMAAPVGVTSATNGDPLGKPPSAAERILRIGIDVQADEVITTHDNDRAHLVFLDGTALTVGPNAQLKIDKFVYDPSTKTGELAVNASKGLFRLVGGKISKTHPITITTPSSTIGIRGGITIVDVQPNKTTSTFIFGNNMTVTGQGQTQNVTRPGSQVTCNTGNPPGPPTLVGQGGLSNQIGQLEGRGGGGNQGGNQGGQGGNPNVAPSADRGAQQFGQVNSGQGPRIGPPGGALGPEVHPGNPNGSNNPQNVVAGSGGQNRDNGNNAPTTSSSNTTTKVIVTKGRYLADPVFSNFNSSDLSVTDNTNNDKAIAQVSNNLSTTTTTTTSHGNTSTTTTSTLTVSVPGLGSVGLPWQQNTLTNGFSIAGSDLRSIGSALGVNNLQDGTGYVSLNGEFFAYVFTTNNNKKIGIFGGTPTNTSGTSGFPTAGIGTFAVGNLGNAANIPFANDTVGGNSDLTNAKVVSKLYAAYSSTLSGTVGSPIPDQRSTALQATISISGTGNQQKSYMGVFIGQFLRDVTTTGGTITTDNGQYLAGNFGGTYRTSANDKIGRLQSYEATPSNGTGNGNAIYGTTSGDGAASGIILTPDKMTTTNSLSGGNITDMTTTRTSSASFSQPYDNLTGDSYFAVTAAYKTATPNTVGQSRTTQTMNGFFGGIVDQVDSNSNFSSRVIGNSDPTNVSISTDKTNNRVSATITVPTWDTGTQAQFNLGGTTGSNVSTSAFIDDNIYAARDHDPSTSTVGGTTTGVASNTQIVSYNTAAVDTLFTNAGVTKCTCAFLSWGWWGGDVAYSNSASYNAGGRDRLNLVPYVAGTLSLTSDVNAQTSTATYNGMMWGNVNNNGKSYIQAGTYQNVWSFGNRSGVVTATFDGTTFGGGVTANTVMTGGATFGTNGTAITSGNKSLTLNGAFFSGGAGNPDAGQAGSFSITGNNYKAGGVFAGQK